MCSLDRIIKLQERSLGHIACGKCNSHAEPMFN